MENKKNQTTTTIREAYITSSETEFEKLEQLANSPLIFNIEGENGRPKRTLSISRDRDTLKIGPGYHGHILTLDNRPSELVGTGWGIPQTLSNNEQTTVITPFNDTPYLEVYKTLKDYKKKSQEELG